MTDPICVRPFCTDARFYYPVSRVPTITRANATLVIPYSNFAEEAGRSRKAAREWEAMWSRLEAQAKEIEG